MDGRPPPGGGALFRVWAMPGLSLGPGSFQTSTLPHPPVLRRESNAAASRLTTANANGHVASAGGTERAAVICCAHAARDTSSWVFVCPVRVHIFCLGSPHHHHPGHQLQPPPPRRADHSVRDGLRSVYRIGRHAQDGTGERVRHSAPPYSRGERLLMGRQVSRSIDTHSHCGPFR